MRFQLKINNIEKHYFQLKQSFGAARYSAAPAPTLQK